MKTDTTVKTGTGENPLLSPDQPPSGSVKSPYPEKKNTQSSSPFFPMSDTNSTKNERREPNGTTLSQEEWFEVLSKHDSFDQYAKRKKEERSEE